MTLSRRAKKCTKCPYKEKCNNKRMEMLAQAAVSTAELAYQAVLIEHDYRDIKITPDTTITIDIEEMKRQLEKDLYKGMRIGLDYGA